MLPLADPGLGSAEAAIDDIRALEEHIAIARPDPTSQLVRRLADDARVNRAGRPAAVGREAAREAAEATTMGSSDEPIRVEASSAGDMVFVLGPARWSDGETRREGYYARIWQRHDGKWQIVFDEIVPRPPAQPAG
jgi:ketosteroid isomerase-like protein